MYKDGPIDPRDIELFGKQRTSRRNSNYQRALHKRLYNSHMEQGRDQDATGILTEASRGWAREEWMWKLLVKAYENSGDKFSAETTLYRMEEYHPYSEWRKNYKWKAKGYDERASSPVSPGICRSWEDLSWRERWSHHLSRHDRYSFQELAQFLKSGGRTKLLGNSSSWCKIFSVDLRL